MGVLIEDLLAHRDADLDVPVAAAQIDHGRLAVEPVPVLDRQEGEHEPRTIEFDAEEPFEERPQERKELDAFAQHVVVRAVDVDLGAHSPFSTSITFQEAALDFGARNTGRPPISRISFWWCHAHAAACLSTKSNRSSPVRSAPSTSSMTV